MSKPSSKIIFGTMRIDRLNEDQLEECLQTCVEQDIHIIDTADIYGAGECERKLGRVFRRNPSLRDQFFLQTKCGIRLEDFTWYDLSKEHIIESVNNSLDRMQVDHIDGLLLHRPDILMDPYEIHQAYDQLLDQGKLSYLGVSNMNENQIEEINKEVQIYANQMQLSCSYTAMIDPAFYVNTSEAEAVQREGDVFHCCQKHNITIQTWSSLQGRDGRSIFQDEQLNTVLERIAIEKHVTPAAIALAWILALPCRMQVVIGTTRPERIVEAAAADKIQLTRKEWYEIYRASGHRLP